MAQKSGSDKIETGDRNTTEANRLANDAPAQPPSSASVSGLPAERRHHGDRRKGLLRAFFYGNFRPRRRSSRRAADAHQFMFDWHEPRILYITLCVLLLSCTDAFFTLKLLDAGASEANVVMASMLEKGVNTFLLVKIGLTSSSLIILVAVARRKFLGFLQVEHLLQAFCIGYILVIYYEIFLFRYVFNLKLL